MLTKLLLFDDFIEKKKCLNFGSRFDVYVSEKCQQSQLQFMYTSYFVNVVLTQISLWEEVGKSDD